MTDEVRTQAAAGQELREPGLRPVDALGRMALTLAAGYTALQIGVAVSTFGDPTWSVSNHGRGDRQGHRGRPLGSLANGAKLLDEHPALARMRLVKAAPCGSQLVLRFGAPEESL
jgi:hypothetical protein